VRPALRKLLETTLAILEADPRISGAWMYGSIGADTEDELSDVDPVFLVNDEDFEAVDSELRPMFERLCERVVLWWPDSMDTAGSGSRNYAVLFEADGDLLQYDVTIMMESCLANSRASVFLAGVTGEQIFFDQKSLISEAISRFEPASVSPEYLEWMVRRFWVYAYIHIKYLLRDDAFKLRFAQAMLFESHVAALQVLQPHWAWHWWPVGAKRACSPEGRKALLDYLAPGDRASVQAAFLREMDTFSRDAKAACEALGVAYPSEVECEVRRSVTKAFGL
jgi:hypothetical protein